LIHQRLDKALKEVEGKIDFRNYDYLMMTEEKVVELAIRALETQIFHQLNKLLSKFRINKRETRKPKISNLTLTIK